MELLEHSARALGLRLTREHLALFQTYYEELIAWNRKLNLTTITGYQDVQLKHFLDSLTCLLALPVYDSEASLPDIVPLSGRVYPLLCADVGSGAGFPGIPLKILRPELRMTLIESSRKKAAFLSHIVQVLGLRDVEVLPRRAEEVGQDAHHRERYDVTLARAVADLTVLAEYCLPLCRVGGRFVAQKGIEIAPEVANAETAVSTLGGRIKEVKEIHLEGLTPRTLVVIEKVMSCPAHYPRRPGIPEKRPIG